MKRLLYIIIILFLLCSLSFGVATVCENATASGQTLTCNLAVVSGDKIIMVSSTALQTPTFSSTSPVLTWTNEINQQIAASGRYIVVADATSNSTGIMTCSVNQGSTQTFWAIFCYDNGPLGVIDISNSATNTVGNSSVSVTTTVANDLLFAANNEAGGGTYTLGGSVTVCATNCTDYVQSGSVVGDGTAVSVTSYTATANGNPTSWGIILIAYKPSGLTVNGGIGGKTGIGGKAGVGL